ncbi:MAG: MFS transporter [Clostridia bacterium]|nr:MFS transporter [Clostridia bacterium]
MKLNYKRTILVGFAFFLISAFWQAYDTIVPLILTNKFHMEQFWSGLIMSLDNVFAVILLPVFGALSDKTKTKIGKRTPYIVFGCVLAAIFISMLSITSSVITFIIVLLACLLSMATFRSPAVALMPDVTLKPLRSKGNAIINLMGTAGGMLVLGLSILFKTSEAGKTDFTTYLFVVGYVMLIALIVFLLTVKETKWSREAERANEQLDREAAAAATEQSANAEPARKLTRSELISLILILASVALWYIGYNAVTSKYSVYATEVLKVPYNTTLLIAQGAAIISYIPVGIVASKLGRKRTILAGVAMLTVAFGAAAFIKEGTPAIVMYVLFSLAGIGWATINVNSFPMVVELAKNGDVGKYTGFYYTASMAAQIVTPMLSGLLVDILGWWVFFPYSAIFAGLAFVTMSLVKHGDAKPESQGALESLGGADD